MRIHPLSFALLLSLAPSLTHAQGLNSASCVENTVGGIISYGITSGKNSAPFSSVAHSTLEQRLYDGNVIRTQAEIRQARDSAGRTREERQMGCAMGEDGQMHPRVSININDPVARESISWTVNDPLGRKVVRINHFPAPPNRTVNPPPTPTPEQQQLRAEQQRLAQLQAQSQRNQIVNEQLGTRTLNGVEAIGTRTTQTIPAGKQGNDMPLVITNEIWRARTLGLTLFAIQDDPRRGKSTFEYTELNLGEPDPSLFTPPAGYTIEETHPGSNMVGGILELPATP
jgi:hypothetical protein